MSVNINPTAKTVTATRSLRKSGSSVVLTIPPEVLQSLGMESGDTMQIQGDWGKNEIRVRRVD